MKKLIQSMFFLFIAFIIVVVLFVSCDNSFSKKATKGKDNLIHSKGLMIGMSEVEVLNIMGKPDTIIMDHDIFYCYYINNDSYGYGQVFFDSTLRVNKLFFPKK